MTATKRPKPGEGVPKNVMKAEGLALQALWKNNRRRSQEKFAEELGFGQGNFSHYVGGRRPIPLEVGIAIADELKCQLADFSPRLAAELAEQAKAEPVAWPFNSITPERFGRLSAGKKLQLEGVLLDALQRMEEDQQPASAPAPAPSQKEPKPRLREARQ